jgi:TetR/AcrR family transcriptional repressor of nem operon
VSTREDILAVTEAMIRQKGYNAVSARAVAAATNIKSSSVHYYFPKKSDMVSAVVMRYTQNFMAALGTPDELINGNGDKMSVAEVKTHYISAFRNALTGDKALCLCAVLGAESGGLPNEVSQHTKVFFESNINWLTAALDSSSNKGESSTEALDKNLKETLTSQAVHILAALEGAMIISQTFGDTKLFDQVAGQLTSPE